MQTHQKRLGWRVILLSGLVLAAILGGCSAETRYKILSVFFDDVPPPGGKPMETAAPPPEKAPPAHPQPETVKAPPPPPAETRPASESLKSWEEVVKALPASPTGGVDWVKALASGVIAPRPSIRPGGAPQPVLPLDVELVPSVGPMFGVVFPHVTHTALLSCTNCHPGLFQMQKGATPISMAAITEGRSCGVCHGKVAFPTTACLRCHPKMGG